MPTTFLKNPVSVTGTAAPATGGGGAQPANTLTVEGTTGQETTGTGETAGAGANVSITAGTGGAAPSGSTNGGGGSVTINPGAPGTGDGTAATNGNVLLATAGGRVGIGTTSPDPNSINTKLNITGDAASNVSLEITGNQPDADAAAQSDLAFSAASNTAGTNGSRIGLIRALTAGSTANNRGGALAFFTKNDGSGLSERMRIQDSGNVGIGTTTPSVPLQVAGSTAVTSLFTGGLTTSPTSIPAGGISAKGSTQAIFEVIGTRTADEHVATFRFVNNPSGGTHHVLAQIHASRLGADDSGALRFHTMQNGSLSEKLTILPSGSVGIGIASPDVGPGCVGLHVCGTVADSTGYVGLMIQNTSPDATARLLLMNDAQVWSLRTNTNDKFILRDNSHGADRLAVDTSGNLGVGTTVPGSKLHVHGGVQVGTPTGGDKGVGSINVSGDIYKNGTPLLAKLEKAYAQIIALTKRIDRLEAGRARKAVKSAKPKKSSKPRKSTRERR